MKTYGFACGRSGIVNLDELFSVQFPSTNNYTVASSYLLVSVAGNIVYQNTAGEICVLVGAIVGYNPIAAVKVLTGATIGGTAYTTGATITAWLGSINS